MALTATDLGRRIREARERAQITQAELGQRIGLDRTAVNKVEAGVRGVTAVELSSIARELSVRMSSFFTEPVQAVVSHRNRLGHESAESRIDHVLSRLADDVELVHSLAPRALTFGVDGGLADVQLRDDADADALAHAVRRAFGASPDEPLGDLVPAAARLGLLAFSTDLGADSADAGTVLLRRGGVALVNSHHKVGRRRLSLAHELGHFVLADDYTVDWRVAGSRDGKEALLDRFARALLLPAAALHWSWADLRGEHGVRQAAVVTASRFRVDMTTLAQRLVETGVDAASANAVRTTTTTRSDIVEHDLVVTDDLAGTSLPRVYERAVLSLYREERISAERALDLLLDTFEMDELPEQRRPRDEEIWDFVS